ncbi:MAG TPA: hypothetical protein VFX98_11835, partial [Longimicrobiaceae bacterium]|nr:hypothetical protein [Longimicrobiaceae bacterium]
MIEFITLRFGAVEGDPPLSFAPGPMTIFVGPNNAGKSLALRETEDTIASGGDSARHIVASLEPLLPDPAQAEAMILERAVEGAAGVTADGWVRIPRIRS